MGPLTMETRRVRWEGHGRTPRVHSSAFVGWGWRLFPCLLPEMFGILPQCVSEGGRRQVARYQMKLTAIKDPILR
jgi:hypothetical protein